MRNRWKRIIFILIFGVFLFLGSLENTEHGFLEQQDYADISWYSDIDVWKPPVWDTTEGTITGDISKKLGVQIELEIPDKNADNQLKWMLINDELPDVISVVDETTENQLATSGKVWRIDEFFEKYKPDSHFLKTYPEDIKQVAVKRNGGWYAIASHIISEDACKEWKPSEQYWIDRRLYGDNSEIIWNRKLLDQLGISIEEVHTEEGIYAALEKAKKADITVNGEAVIPFLLDGKDYYETAFRLLMESFGAEYINDKSEYTDCVLQPETKDALKFLNTIYLNGYMNASDFTLESAQVKELCNSGRVLCFVGNIADLAATEDEWASAGAVLSSSGKHPVHGKNNAATAGWIKTFISKDCKNPEKVAEWIDYMTSDEGMQFWFFGYEGSDYTVGEDGLIYRTKQGVQAEVDYSETGVGAWWPFSNTAWARSVMTGDDEKKYGNLQNAYGKDTNTIQYNSALLGFPKDIFPAGTHELQMEQDIDAWKKEQVLAVILAKDEETFESEYKKLIDGLYERGIRQIDSIKNRAYQNNCKEAGESLVKIN